MLGRLVVIPGDPERTSARGSEGRDGEGEHRGADCHDEAVRDVLRERHEGPDPRVRFERGLEGKPGWRQKHAPCWLGVAKPQPAHSWLLVELRRQSFWRGRTSKRIKADPSLYER